jgi:hypothetical protein
MPADYNNQTQLQMPLQKRHLAAKDWSREDTACQLNGDVLDRNIPCFARKDLCGNESSSGRFVENVEIGPAKLLLTLITGLELRDVFIEWPFESQYGLKK